MRITILILVLVIYLSLSLSIYIYMYNNIINIIYERAGAKATLPFEWHGQLRPFSYLILFDIMNQADMTRSGRHSVIRQC